MSTIKVLQKPTIIEIVGQATIRIAHPDISAYTRSFLRSPFTKAATSMSLYDNDNFEDGDWFIMGEKGEAQTEECDVNGAVTRGNSVTITNTTKFDHDLDDPVTRIFERKITIYGAATDGGSLTEIKGTGSAIDIQWNKPYTEFNLLSGDTTYAYYVVKFYDGTTESSASDYVAAAGHGRNVATEIIRRALHKVGAKLGQKNVDEQMCISAVQEFQEAVQDYGDWSWELTLDDTSITAAVNENKYAVSALTYELKYPDSEQGIYGIFLGTHPIKYFSFQEYEEYMEDKVRGSLASDVAIGATSVTLSDSYEFPSAATAQVGTDSFTWDTNTKSTGVLSGIAATDIAATHSSGDTVWYGISSGTPTRWAIFDGNLYFDYPIDSDYTGFKIKVRYLRKLTAISEMSDSTEIPFYTLADVFVASRIEFARRNKKAGKDLEAEFYAKLEAQHERLKLPTTEEVEYYKFPDL